MEKVARYVGLDVHKESITIAVADGSGGESSVVGKIPNQWQALSKTLKRLGPSQALFVCYEAGPCGYGLYRRLSAAGYFCMVVAPSMIPKAAGDRVKNDRRDAKKLARLFRSGDLVAVWVPDEESEAVRDLIRARDDAKKAERVTRQQLGKFLLRHGRRFPGKTSWSVKHLEWIRTQRFEQQAQQLTLEDYLHAVLEATERVSRLDKAIEEQVKCWSRAPLVKALQAFRGVRLLTAAAVTAEIGDFRRFSKAPQFMSFLGLTPSESSTGDDVRRFSITRTGNKHVRRFLVESSWSYRFRPGLSYELRRRNKGVCPEVRRIAWKAQKRLHERYVRLSAKGKPKQKVVTAVARELAGFIWAAANEIQRQQPQAQ